MSVTTGPKIGVMSGATAGSGYLDEGNRMLRMLQSLVQANVIAQQNDPPVSPNNGDTYVVGAAPTGVWIGKANNIAYWTLDDPASPGGEWDFYIPQPGWLVYDQSQAAMIQYVAGVWGPQKLVIPGQLTNTFLYNDYFQTGVSTYPTGEVWRVASGSYTVPSIETGSYGGAPFGYPPPNLGIARAITSAAANNGVSMDVNGGSAALALNGSIRTQPYIRPDVFNAPWIITFLFNLIGPLTNMKIALGIRDGYIGYPTPYNGLQFGYDTTLGDVNWTIRSYVNGTGVGTVRATTSVPVAIGWHKLIISGGNGNLVNWFLDGILVASTLSDYTYQNNNQHLFFSLYTTDAIAKTVDLDFWSLSYPTLSR